MQTKSRSYELGHLQAEDVHWFVEVAAISMLEDELKRPELVNREQLYYLTAQVMEAKTAFIVKKDGENIGAIAAVPVPNLFNPKLVTMAELFWYVLPEHRESRAGAMLLKAFDDCAAESADEATMSLLPTSIVNTRSLEKRGFMFGEVGFRKVYGDD